MEEYYIRIAMSKDVKGIAQLEKICFEIPWSEESFKLEIENNKCAHYVVAVIKDKVVGYGGMWLIVNEAHITNIAVHPDYRGFQIGESIMRSLMEKAVDSGIHKMTLEVRVSNKIAQNLYKKLGFVEAGIRKGYYGNNGEDALIMWNLKVGE